MAARDVTATWVKTNKASVKHPHLSGYSEVALRVRFLKGFEEEALSILQGIAHELGRRGLAHKPYPISKAVLMSPENLTTDAFTTAREKEAVPAYRDGHNGAEAATGNGKSGAPAMLRTPRRPEQGSLRQRSNVGRVRKVGASC